MTSQKNLKKLKKFLETERMHAEMYAFLADEEEHPKHKRFLRKILKEERSHEGLLSEILKEEGMETGQSPFLGARIGFYKIVSKLFGVPFGIATIERHEDNTIKEYITLLSQLKVRKHSRKLEKIIDDEKGGEAELQENLRDYSKHFDYIKSVVFGLNDGLVEILAVVAGLAVISTTPITVVIGGIIVGISGTLSMAAGAYLSAKSYKLVEEENAGMPNGPVPVKDAIYTGVFYFLGALASIVPFAAGLDGFAGIFAAIIVVSIVLIIASAVIGVVSRTSIRKRSAEMLTISLGTALITILLGILLRANGILI